MNGPQAGARNAAERPFREMISRPLDAGHRGAPDASSKATTHDGPRSPSLERRGESSQRGEARSRRREPFERGAVGLPASGATTHRRPAVPYGGVLACAADPVLDAHTPLPGRDPLVADGRTTLDDADALGGGADAANELGPAMDSPVSVDDPMM
jgi:hypothetical protein